MLGILTMRWLNIKLNTGREIRLDELSQHYTYAGLIEGKPDRKMNQRIIKSSVELAKSKLAYTGEPFLIPPKETGIELNDMEIGGPRDLYDKERMKIPAIVCLSGWNCYEPARDSEKMCSFLKIVWFQEEFAMPIYAAIIEKIKAIDWEKHAIDYDI